MYSFTVTCDTFSNEENDSSKFFYFVGKVLDEKTGKFSTRVNGWQYLRQMFI